MISETQFRALDRRFAQLMCELAHEPGPELELAARLVSLYSGQGHICLPLHKVGSELAPAENVPPLASWREKLEQSRVVGVPGDFTPLILDHKGRLYLRRYWEYEQELAKAIRERVESTPPKIDHAELEKSLDLFFPPGNGAEPDWQRRAAFVAVTKNFAVISGGPGTGKTRTVVIILALLLEQAQGKLKISLCAPTGKAAARLTESIENTKEVLKLTSEEAAKLPSEATTIHRLLGNIPDSPYFQRNRKSPLLSDVVIVDEASMVDLALLAKLFEALKPSARIILLGDKDQLASVEAGAVLGDICSGEQDARNVQRSTFKAQRLTESAAEHPLKSHIVELRKNYRFGSDSGIFELSQMVNRGEANEAFAFLQEGQPKDFSAKKLPAVSELKRQLKPIVLEHYRDYLKCSDPKEAIGMFNRFRILCAVKVGSYGVAGLNELVEEILSDERLIRNDNRWYHGRPVMITRNDYNLKLFNGDVGLALRDSESSNQLRVFFPAPEGGVRKFLPSRLPVHETVFAMTVHKSQGSEFKRVLFILPDHESAVLTRELVYTGLTRAREHVELWTNEEPFKAAIAKRIERASGLRDLLWRSP